MILTVASVLKLLLWELWCLVPSRPIVVAMWVEDGGEGESSSSFLFVFYGDFFGCLRMFICSAQEFKV